MACVVAGFLLVASVTQLGAASSPDIVGTVVIIVVLLAAGVVLNSRPWSDC